MSKLRITQAAGLVGLVLLVMIVFLGCENKLKGTARANTSPVIKFSNIPPDSAAFSFNPEVSWYALDIDGYVTQYQYAVIIADTIESRWSGGTVSAVDSACSLLVRIPPDIWVDSLQRIDSTISFLSAVDTTVSIVKVQLFARENPNDTITQYLFVRAIDNDSAISNIIHRMFSRNNHPPKAHINYTPFRDGTVVKSVYCLPETTETWKGIKLTWEGSDSDDYLGTQPDFVFKWELWGPFADSFALTSAKYNELVADSSHRLVTSSFNKEDSTRLVEDKSLLVPFLDSRTNNKKFLVNYPHTVPNYSYPDAGYGWYLFIVWALDDAFTFSNPFASNNPDGHLWFKTIHPQLGYQPIKKILIVDCANYGRADVGGDKDSVNVRTFYQNALQAMISGGLCNSFTFKRYSAADVLTPSKDTLSRYNLVMYLNEGKPLACGWLLDYKEYMRVGGKVWAIGNNVETFGLSATGTGAGLKVFENEFTTGGEQPYVDFATTYFSLLGMYQTQWSYITLNQEFIGANRFGTFLNVPNLKRDSAKVVNQVNWAEFAGGAKDTIGARIPHSSAQYLGQATRIYTFVSHPLNAPGSQLHDKPCGAIYEGPTYKTAHLSFALHYIEEGVGGAKRDSLFSTMLGWFWEE